MKYKNINFKIYFTSKIPSSGKSEQCTAFCTLVLPYFARRVSGLTCRAISYIKNILHEKKKNFIFYTYWIHRST